MPAHCTEKPLLQFEVLIQVDASGATENYIIEAHDFNHAVSEVVDENGWSTILAIAQAPYSFAGPGMRYGDKVTI